MERPPVGPSDVATSRDDETGPAGAGDREVSLEPSGPLYPLTVFCVWAGLLFVIVYLTGALTSSPPPWTRLTTTWDNGWYLSIANDGYHTHLTDQSNVAFFPLYPLLIRWISRLGVDPSAAGVAVSLTCYLLALLVLYRLLLERFSTRTARASLLLLAFWPFSFFFGLVYTESLFLLLAAATFYCIHRKWWWAAAVCAGLGSGTRLAGVFLGVAVVMAFWAFEERATARHLGKLLALGVVGTSGLVAFMIYLRAHTGSFLAFVEVQKYWPGRADGIVGLKAIVEFLRAGPDLGYQFAFVLLYLVPMVLFLGLSVYVFVRIDTVWATFCLLTLLAPVTTGSIASTNRYVSVLFPCFVGLAQLLKDRSSVAVGALAGLLGLFTYHHAYHSTIFLG